MESLKVHACVALISAVFAGWLWLKSGLGLGTTPDSMSYIAGARGLLLGEGFGFPDPGGAASPITQFPPLFSAVLAALGTTGIDLLDGARWLNALLFLLNGYLAGLLIYQATARMPAAIIAAALTVTSPALLTVHSMLWSEPLFLFLILAAVMLIARYCEAPSRPRLIAAMVPVLLAPLSRYSGIALIPAVALVIGRRNIRHGAVLALGGSLGLVAWLIRNYFAAGDWTSRQFAWHVPTLSQLAAGFDSIIEWLGGAAIASVLLLLVVFTRPRRVRDPRADLLLAFAGSYLVVLAGSLLFVDAYTPLDDRILCPLFLAASLYMVAAVALRCDTRLLRAAWAGLLVLFLVVRMQPVVNWLDFLSTQGVGFSSIQWRQSPTIAYLKGIDDRARVYTNAPDSVYLLVGMRASALPQHTDPSSRLANSDYAKQLGQISGLLVYFRAVTWRWYLPDEERLRADLPLRLIADLGDGAVYRIETMNESRK